MRVRPIQAALVCCLGLFGASSLPFYPPAGGVEGFLSAPIRFIQREASAQEAGSSITPSHVYQAVSDLLSEIEVVREAMGITDYPLEAEPQEDRAPIHAYAKSLEVLEKISDAQRRLGMNPGKVGQIPIKAVAPKDVYRSVQNSLAEVRKIKEQLVIEDQIRPTEFEGGKTPSLVYQILGDASYLLDGLVGHPTDLNDVYRNLAHVQGDMELVAAKFEVGLEREAPIVEQRKRLKEVAQQVMRGTFKIINLQTRLGMDASGVPQVTLVRVTPAQIYEAINILQAEMVRIKAHLGIEVPHEERVVARNKRPTDVFAQALLFIKNLDRLAKAADGYTSG